MRETKDTQRKRGISARNSLSEAYRNEASENISDKISSLPEFKDAKTVMIYRAVRSEVNVNSLSADKDKIIAFPVCLDNSIIEAYSPNFDDAWKKGAFGIPEPDISYSDRIAPDKIDVIICPCTAFDKRMNRCGMGGGFYDRFLIRCKNAVKIAAAFDAQCQGELSTGLYDVKMDIIVTETAVYRKN